MCNNRGPAVAGADRPHLKSGVAVPMSRELAGRAAVLFRCAAGALGLAVGIGAAAVSGTAHASPPTGGPTGFHEGMLPPGSPDAQLRNGSVGSTATAATAT